MSRGRAPTVMPPRLLTPRTWTPATPTRADSMGTPTMVSASSTARRIELTARTRFTIWPLRQPFDSAAPTAAKRTVREVEIHELAFAPALRFGRGERGEAHAAEFVELADQRAGFGAADV